MTRAGGQPDEEPQTIDGPSTPGPEGSSDAEPTDLQAEVLRLEAELAALMASRDIRWRTRSRSAISSVLVVLMALSVVAAIAATWLHETLLDTETFIDTITPVLAEPVVTDAIGEYLTKQTFLALEVEKRVDARLSSADAYIEEQVLGLLDLNPRIENRLANIDRPRFSDLTGPLVFAAEGAVRDAVQTYLGSEEFQASFEVLATRAHQASVALLRGEYEEVPNVVIDSTSVRLDLTPAVAATIQSLVAGGVGIVGFDPPAGFTVPVDTPETARAWLTDTFGIDLEPDFAQITIMSADRLEALQGAVTALDRLVWLLVILVVALVVAAVWVAPRKSRALVQLAIAVVVSIVLGRLAMDPIEQAVVDAFGDPAGREVARIFLGNTLTSLRLVALIVVIAAVGVGLVAFGIGRQWHRRAIGWIGSMNSSESETAGIGLFVAAHSDGLRVFGIALAVATLFLTGLGFTSILVVGLLLATYLWGLEALGRSSSQIETDVDLETDSAPAKV